MNRFFEMKVVSKSIIRITLPYLGKMSQIAKTRLTKTMNKHMKFCKFRVIFQTKILLSLHKTSIY